MIDGEQERKFIPLNERDPVEVASRCQKIGKPSAQFNVYLLPEEYHHDVSPTGSFDDTVEVRRVLKVAHDTSRTYAAVRQMNIPPEEMDAKAAFLEAIVRFNMPNNIDIARYSGELCRLFGFPLLACQKKPVGWYSAGYHMSYTQDYIRPVSDVLAELDTENNEEDLQVACRLVDDYIDAQLLLCSYGMFDDIFKFCDNYGQCREDVLFVDRFERFRMMDIGEMCRKKERVLECIRNKEWRSIIHNIEYTQLPPLAQEYFNDALEARLTEATVEAVWATGYGNSKREPSWLGYDDSIPFELPEVLWQKDA